MHFETLQLYAGQEVTPTTNSRAVPIYKTSSYVFNSSEHGANLFIMNKFCNIDIRMQNIDFRKRIEFDFTKINDKD